MLKIIWLILFLSFTGSNLNAYAQPRKIIIDTDPGVEDAMQLIGAMQYPGMEISGITTTTGGTNIGKPTKNALRIVELLGKNIPVFQGAAKPLFLSPNEGPDFVNGDDGLGNTHQPEPKTKAQQKPAAQFIVDMAKTYPGQITILALGRLTNLADAIRLDSSVTHNIKEVVVVAGALRVPGLASPVAEPDVSMDPHAADMVFTAPWKVTMLGLDVTMKITINDALLLRIKNENLKYGPFIYSISRFTRDFQMKALHINGFRDFGAAAIVYIVDSSVFKFRKGPVRVVTEGIAIGQTIMPTLEFHWQQDPWRGKPSVSAAIDVDVERYLKYYEAIMKGTQK